MPAAERTTLTATGMTRPQQHLPLLVTPASVALLPQQQNGKQQQGHQQQQQRQQQQRQQQQAHTASSQPAATGSVDDFLVDTLKRVIMEFKKTMKKQQRQHRRGTNHNGVSAVGDGNGRTTSVASVNAADHPSLLPPKPTSVAAGEPETDFRRRSPQRSASVGREQ